MVAERRQMGIRWKRSMNLDLPPWVVEFVKSKRRYHTDTSRMKLVLQLLREQIRRKTGGPFSAVIFDLDTGEVVELGLNRVLPNRCSLQHAESTAIFRAQAALGTHDLSSVGRRLGLYSSCTPCIQCFGTTWWSGISRFVAAATGEDAEEIGFNEGPVPTDWARRLRKEHGMSVRQRFMQPRAREMMRRYKGAIYNAGTERRVSRKS